jgi:hypothetical protein
MKGSTHQGLDYWIRTCCTNWLYLKHEDVLKSYDMEAYKKYRFETSEMVMKNPIFSKWVKPLDEAFFFNKNYKLDDDQFNELQEQVFKVLDLIDNENKANDDFTD